MTKKINKIGMRFGRLVPVREIEGNRYECICDCGNTKITMSVYLGKRANSCGCLRNYVSGTVTHGGTGSPEYYAWKSMKRRCLDRGRKFKYYGARGISVCEEWKNSFENFYDDMGSRPSPKHSLDRINNDGNYEKSNCRWATLSEQNSNRSPLPSRRRQQPQNMGI